MTKQDFDRLAYAINAAYLVADNRDELGGITITTGALVAELERGYHKFDKSKFLALTDEYRKEAHERINKTIDNNQQIKY